jgi:NTE family protein
MGTTALVLNGGSIRGAFQVGAIKAILEKGYKFDFIYGVSVGSLNSSFMTNEIGKQNVTKDSINWQVIGNNLMNFWIEKIKKPENIAKKRSTISLMLSIKNKFKGVVDTDPIQSLVRDTIKMENLQRSPVKLTVGAVNISDGEIVYADPSFPNFIDYVIASTAIPVMMPYIEIGGNASQPFFDGGVRDIAPLKKAIESGADEIVCVTCHSKKLGGSTSNYRNLMNLANRMMEILENEIVNNDIDWAETCNTFLPSDGTPATEGPLKGYRKFKLTVIRPPQPINLDLENFKPEDIKAIIDSGYQTAKEILAI